MSIMTVRKDNHLNPDCLLGYLEFHSIPQLRIYKSDLAQLWQKHRLPNEFLPGEIRPCDAFRRASATAKRTVNVNWQGSEYTARLMVREVKSDAKEIVRLLVREVVDTRNEVLDYATVGKMAFDRERNSMKGNYDMGYLSEFDYRSIMDNVAATFDDYVNYHTRDTVRNIVNKVIRSTNPVRIIPRSQGKFIPRRAHGTLLGLQVLLKELNAHSSKQECSMDLIPIVDTMEQRQLVAKRVKAELGTEMDALVAELAEQLKVKDKDKDVSVESVKRMVGRAQDIQQRAAEYEKMLNVRLSVLRSQLNEFINKTMIATSAEENKVVG